MPRMPVSIDAPRELRALAAPLRTVVARALAVERRRAGEIAVVLTGDDALRRLNRQWRGIDKATDVISFAYDEHEPDAATRPVTGDLVVSMDRVRVQAKRFRVTPGAELARLVVHGALHLCGHDHRAAGERGRMREREDQALAGAKGAIRTLDRGLKASRA
jgi:rRNA maturation RNase YbeY